eukprot:3420428-Rhodomonas_salina.2
MSGTDTAYGATRGSRVIAGACRLPAHAVSGRDIAEPEHVCAGRHHRTAPHRMRCVSAVHSLVRPRTCASSLGNSRTKHPRSRSGTDCWGANFCLF